MPSAEDTTYLIEVMPEPGANRRQDGFTSRDVDVLVSRIKENLRLSGLKSRSSLAQKMRSTPYALPSSRAWADPAGAAAVACKLCAMRRRGDRSAPPESEALLHQRKLLQQQQQQRGRCRHCRSKQASSRVRAADLDSYERFQALLRNGALIKEAVKRLQTCPEDNDEDEEGAGKRRATSTSATSTTLDSMDDDEEEEEEEEEDEVLLTGRDGGEDEVGGDGDEDDHFFYRRKRFYYNSEEEPLPPVYQPLDL